MFLFFAALAGACGALSGIFGKLSVDDSWPFAVPVRVVLFSLNIVATSFMWRYYLKALALGPTPIAQMVNTAANFAVTAVVGIGLFGEAVSSLWCIGAALTCVGLSMIAKT